MTRRILPRLLVAAATLTALVAAVTLFAGSGFASGSAAQANYAPTLDGGADRPGDGAGRADADRHHR